MKFIKRTTDILSAAVYLCIIGFLAIAAPLVLGWHPVVVLSGSMEPAYHVGSVIYYKEAPFNEIGVGDPITFLSGDGGVMVTHRVAEKDEAAMAFATEGDANGGRDPGMVPYSNVKGKASSFCIPYAGYFVSYGKQPAAIALMASILAAGAIADSTMKAKKRKAGGSDQEEGRQDAGEA